MVFRNSIGPVPDLGQFVPALGPGSDFSGRQRANSLVEALAKVASKDRQQPLYNISPFTFAKLIGDPNGLARNLTAYIKGFSPKVREIFEKFEFEKEIEKLDEANRLFEVVKEFSTIDLHPKRVDNLAMGYVFENLIRRFNEQAKGRACTEGRAHRILPCGHSSSRPFRHLSIVREAHASTYSHCSFKRLLMDYSIGQLAGQAGYAVQTVRYYEETGLMPAPPRTGGGQRRYGAEHLSRLLFIRHARDLGFEVEDIRSLLELAGEPERSCAAVDEIARRHLTAVDTKLARLAALRAELQRMLRQCKRGRVADCRIISALNSHGGCEHARPAPRV
jgi:DNA-binding transcriptional MerR regulator